MHNQQPIRLKNDDTVIRATHSPFVRAMGFCFLLLSVCSSTLLSLDGDHAICGSDSE